MQNTFDKVCLHLLKQGRRALEDGMWCAFKAPNGDMCAAGCLIKNYDPEMEGFSVVFNEPVQKDLREQGHDIDLVIRLQRIHDGVLPDNWPKALLDLAYELKLAVPQQLTFQFVALEMIKQGRRAVNNDGRCAYRGRNGDKCAAGHLIPDEKYQPEYEGRACLNSPVGPLIASLGHSVDLARALQCVHDGYEPNEWQPQLKRTGLSYELDVTFLN
jgi:hypothetical protein